MRDIKFIGKANRAYFFKSDGVDEVVSLWQFDNNKGYRHG